MKINRRTLIQSAILAGAGGVLGAGCAATTAAELRTEEQRGDPDLAYETVTFEPLSVDGDGRARYRDRARDFPQMLIAQAEHHVGMNRQDNEKQIAEMLQSFYVPFRKPNGDYNAYCAAGLSYVTAAAYLQLWQEASSREGIRSAFDEIDRYHFYPSASVRDIYNVALGKRRWVAGDPKTNIPKPGWLVVYDFGKGADHVGLIKSAGAQTLITIEFNTTSGEAGDQANGGKVAQRSRPYNNRVKGFVRTDLS